MIMKKSQSYQTSAHFLTGNLLDNYLKNKTNSPEITNDDYGTMSSDTTGCTTGCETTGCTTGCETADCTTGC